MQKPEIPANESDRLVALDRYQILDTLPEQEYDDLTQLAADICGTPIALISLIDRDRQWFKSKVGLDGTETPRDISFCAHVVAAEEMLYVPDTNQDSRFFDNPLVTDNPNIRFYTGVPLRTPDDFILGTLCVIDVQPRELTSQQIKQLEALSRLVISQLELRRINERASLQAYALESSNDAIITKTLNGMITSWNHTAEMMFGYTEAEVIGQPMVMLFPSDRLEEENKILESIRQGERIEHFETVRLHKDGMPLDVSATISPVIDSYGRIVGVSKIIRDITALKKSQTQFRDIISALDQTAIVTIADAFGNFTMANDQFCQVSKYSREEIIGQNYRILYSGHHSDEFFADMWKTIANGQTWRGDIKDRAKDGSFYWVDTTIVPFLDEQGKPYQYLSIRKDITASKEAHIEFQKLSLRLELAIKSGQIGVWEWDISQNKMTWDKRIYELYDISQSDEQVNYDVWFNAVHPDDRAGVITLLQQTTSDNAEYDTEFRIVHRDGSIRYIKSQGIFKHNEQGNPLVMYGINYDISDRKRVELELKKLADRLSVALESGAIGIWVWDAISNKVTWDDRQYQLHGIENTPEVSVDYASWLAMIHPEDRTRCDSLIQQVLLGSSEYDTEFRVVHPDGKIVYIKSYATVFRDDHGVLLSMIGVNYDISDRKRAELLLNESNQQLRAANEELARISRFKDEFLANMSHEIRTPMNAIIGMNYLILKTELTTHQRNYLEKAQMASHHLLGLINDILDFSKIEAGKLTIEQIDFKLETVLENVVNLISEKASSKGLEIIFDLDRDLPRNFIGDPLRLGQVLTNYVSNAVKFTNKGEITIIVKLQEYRENEVVLYMAVKDTGIGLKEEQMKLLFHSFQQADASTTRKFGGTGLGLAISKRIVTLMGGAVGVESEFGKGSTFWFTVCLGKSTMPINASPLADTLAKPIEPDELGKVLLKWIPPNPILIDISNPSTLASFKGEEEIVIPTNISGLDTSEGLRRVIGKRSLYLSMLRKFVAGQKNFTTEISKALDIENTNLAERLAHNLRGLAGNIGAGEIQQAAANLEDAIKNQQFRPEIETLLVTLRSPLAQLIDQLENKLPPEAIANQVAIAFGKLEEVCDRFSVLLLSDDAEAADLLQDHTDLLQNAFQKDFKAIEDGVSLFDFEDAHAALILARKNLKK
jgi:PAS domain S-box-containing protein